MTPDADVVVVGAGIVGMAAALAIQHRRPAAAVVVMDKEPEAARHQTGRNSGVVHSGLYYAPGSDKAQLVTRGRVVLERFAAEHGVRWEQCGKVVVATRQSELAALDALAQRGVANGVTVQRVGPAELHRIEPHVRGIAALQVPGAAITDYGQITRAMVSTARSNGADVRMSSAVTAIDHGSPTHLTVRSGSTSTTTRVLVNCAGLHSDRVARLAGCATDVAIIPFRGEYATLSDRARPLVRNLVYPVPDPRWPFLGVHLTRMVDGHVHVGPNAVLALGREAYDGGIDPADTAGLLANRGLRRLARRYWRTGATEMLRSRWRRLMLSDVRRLLPEIEAGDLMAAPAGIRAQAISAEGVLLDDFAFGESHRAVHVLNAPSPAATASLAIGDVVASRALAVLDRSA